MDTFDRPTASDPGSDPVRAAPGAARGERGGADVADKPERPDKAEMSDEGRAGDGTARTRRRVAGLTATAAAGYAVYALVRFHTFRTGTYDLVIFDQAVRSYSRFEPGTAIVKGVHNGFGPDFSVLGDHFSPMLALLAPLYWIWDDPRTLLIAQALLLAAAIPPLWVYTRRALGVRAAHLVASAYALSWPVAETVAFDFHEVAFAPVLTAVLLERHQAGRRVHALLAVAALLLVKEDMGLLAAGFGLYLLTRRGERGIGAGLLVAGVGMTWLASRVLIPSFGGDPDYYWAYAALGPDLPSAAAHALTHPWDALRLLVTPPVKLQTMALLALPLLLVPLRSPVALAALPLLLERMLASTFPNWWASQFHYNAFIVVVLFAAGVDGARRLRDRPPGRLRARVLASGLTRRLAGGGPARRVRRIGPPYAVAVLAVALALVPFFAFKRSWSPHFYQQDVRARAAAAAIARVPDGVLVEAANYVGPQLSGRTRVLLWDWEPRWAPWVVADVEARTFPFKSLAEQRERVDLLRGRGYRLVFQREGYLVLHRSGPDPVLKRNR